MYKVLVVDDEINIRKGLIHIIDWKHFGCEVVGEAMDGVEGLEKIKALKPDIVIADINMPEMDGLEMIDAAKDVVDHTKFIILTGYRDFSYLQEALRIGAFDYILKPSKIEKISAVLKKAVVELKYQNEYASELDRMRERFSKSLPLLREKLLSDYILRRKSLQQQDEDLQVMYGLNVEEFVLLLFTLEESDDAYTAEQRYLYQFGIMNTVDEILGESYEVEKISLNENQVAMVVQNGSAIDTADLYKKIESIHALLKTVFDFFVTVSISTKGYGIKDLGSKMRECEKCMDYQFYLGKDSIIIYDDLEGFYNATDELDVESLDEEIVKHIKAGDVAQLKNSLSLLGDMVKRQGPSIEVEQIKMFYSNMIYKVNGIRVSIKALGSEADSVSKSLYSFYQMVETCSDIYELHEILEEVAVSLTEKVEAYNQNSIHSTLQLAIDFIDENFTDQVTLEELAKHAFVSPYYLSRMFKKELGKNFVDYLNEKRIAEAKLRLENISLKTYEVAESVGISDAHYFSRLFKKYTGMTPTDYRNQL